METKYKVIDGTSFYIETPDNVCHILNRAINSNKSNNRQRLLFDYGNVETGQSWGDKYDIRGYIGRSTGTSKIPLLIANSRSMGGGSILTHCIIKITDVTNPKRKTILYQHPNYKPFLD